MAFDIMERDTNLRQRHKVFGSMKLSIWRVFFVVLTMALQLMCVCVCMCLCNFYVGNQHRIISCHLFESVFIVLLFIFPVYRIQRWELKNRGILKKKRPYYKDVKFYVYFFIIWTHAEDVKEIINGSSSSQQQQMRGKLF